MFTNVRVRRFKAYRDSGNVPLRPLTVILGANNSGKSSLLHAILLLAQTLEDTTSRQPLVTSGSFVDLGGYYDIVWGGTGSSDAFTIELSVTPASVSQDIYFLGREENTSPPTDLRVSFSFDARRNAIAVSSCAVTGNGQTFLSARRSGQGYSSPGAPPKGAREVRHTVRHFLPTYLVGGDVDFRKERALLNFV